MRRRGATSAGPGILREAFRPRRTSVGLALCLLIAALAVIGPYVVPYAPTDYIDLSFAPPSSHPWLGTDYLGRDVFSRFLAGGQNLLVLAVLSTALNIVTGTIVAL